MAERLRDRFGPEVPDRIAQMLRVVLPDFDVPGFTSTALADYDQLELTQRARSIAEALERYLPSDRCRAIELITRALPDTEEAVRWQGMDSFVLLPFGMFIADRGLDCFEESMTAQYEITKRFTSEFSIRSFIQHRYEPTMARLREWADDPDDNVRRLVSEGTRPRLPWAARLERFQRDPRPVLGLLELLKDDPSDYVRRSVGNNLNDIAKDHPRLVVETCTRWWVDGDANRRALIRRALRTLVKRGDPAALAVLGFEADTPLRLADSTIEPDQPRIGDRLTIRAEVVNPTDTEHAAIVDFAIDFAKAAGKSGTKVFKGREIVVAPHGSASVAKTVSLAQQSTRTHYEGRHMVTALINGSAHPIGAFELLGDQS